MAELIERLMGIPGFGSVIPGHYFESAAAEWARGRITGAQANAIILAVSGEALSAAAQTEAQAIVALVTNITVPLAPVALGNNPSVNALRDYALAWGNRDQALALQAREFLEIMQVLMIAGQRLPPYDTPGAVRTRLGLL